MEKYDVKKGMNRVEEIIQEISNPSSDLEKTNKLYAEAMDIIVKISGEIQKVEEEIQLKVEQIDKK